jgi:hypothetical protein
MGNVSGTNYREMKTGISCTITFFLENLAIYGIMWKIFYSRAGSK